MRSPPSRPPPRRRDRLGRRRGRRPAHFYAVAIVSGGISYDSGTGDSLTLIPRLQYRAHRSPASLHRHCSRVPTWPPPAASPSPTPSPAAPPPSAAGCHVFRHRHGRRPRHHERHRRPSPAPPSSPLRSPTAPACRRTSPADTPPVLDRAHAHPLRRRRRQPSPGPPRPWRSTTARLQRAIGSPGSPQRHHRPWRRLPQPPTRAASPPSPSPSARSRRPAGHLNRLPQRHQPVRQLHCLGARPEYAWLEAVSGTAQSLPVSGTPSQIALRLRDMNGNPMAGGTVTLYQALYAWAPPCPPARPLRPAGRCSPPKPLRQSRRSTAPSPSPRLHSRRGHQPLGLAATGNSSTLSIAIEQHP